MCDSNGYTGRLFEIETLGSCLARHRGYMQWRKAIELVRENQPRVMSRFAQNLEQEVMKQTGLSAMFYTAVSSTLDKLHGVDAFFWFRGVVVTIDLTTNPNKDACKADVLVVAEDVQNLPVLARRIARELTSKLSGRA